MLDENVASDGLQPDGAAIEIEIAVPRCDFTGGEHNDSWDVDRHLDVKIDGLGDDAGEIDLFRRALDLRLGGAQLGGNLLHDLGAESRAA